MDLREKSTLDEALETAQKDKKHVNFFYDAFLNSDLFIPVLLEDAETGSWKQIGLKDNFVPLFLTHEGTRVVPVFDRLERLQDWAGDRKLDFLLIRCHIFLRVLSQGMGVTLNIGQPLNYFFPPNILGLLRAHAKPATLS